MSLRLYGTQMYFSALKHLLTHSFSLFSFCNSFTGGQSQRERILLLFFQMEMICDRFSPRVTLKDCFFFVRFFFSSLILVFGQVSQSVEDWICGKRLNSWKPVSEGWVHNDQVGPMRIKLKRLLQVSN